MGSVGSVSKYHCPKCGIEYDTLDELQVHIRKSHIISTSHFHSV